MKTVLCILLLLIVLLAFGVVIITLIRVLIQQLRHMPSPKTIGFLKKNALIFLISLLVTAGFLYYTHASASTPAIKDAQGDVLEGSIAQLKEIELNGRKEWISIRGRDQTKPVLLFLAGGPGGSQMAAVRHELSKLEEDFVVVNWDQPGSGKSFHALPTSQLSISTYIEDGLALTSYLQDMFHQEKIYLLGESWGSALAIFLAAEKPEQYHAVIGTGQMIDFVETEQLDYQKAIELANAKGDTKKVDKLLANGMPPYYGSDVTWKSMEYLNYLSAYMASDTNIQNGGYQTIRDITSSEYGFFDQINYLLGLATTFNHVYPQLYETDLREDYPKMDVPLYFFLGRHDINAPLSLVQEYYDLVEAPLKKIVWFEHSGHSPWINEPDAFVQEIIKIVQAKQ